MNLRKRFNFAVGSFKEAFFQASVELHTAATSMTRSKRLTVLAPIAALTVLVALSAVAAATCGGLNPNDANTGEGQIVKLINRISWFLIAVGFAIAMGAFAWAGILFMTAVGNTDRASKGMKLMKNVLIGAAILVSGAAIKTVLLTFVSGTGDSIAGQGTSKNLKECAEQGSKLGS